MKLIVERTGGFAGLRRYGEKDGAALSAEEFAALEKLFATSPQTVSTSPGSDRFAYMIEVQDETGTKRINASEASMPKILADIAVQ